VDLWLVPHDAFEVGNPRRLTDAKLINGQWHFQVPLVGWQPIPDKRWTPTHWRHKPTAPEATS